MSYRTLDARVWATNCLTDGELIYGFRSDKSLEDEERAADTMSRAERGEPQPADHFPKEMYVASEFEKIKTVPDIFTSGFWVVSARFAEVLRRFELGQTGLYPVKLFHHDRKTPFEGEYFVLAFGETKDTFVPEESPEADTVFMRKDVWQAKRANNKDSLAFDKSVLNGVDLWMEKKIMYSFFMSVRLVEALKAEKLSQKLRPYRCRVVSNLH
ncbi:imm11 family protein [Vreelandella titanicae]|uniref:imm11 family protein n=1 Tax=Vreelandella titanicae TaxID=664683 RepID=UPI0039BF7B72